MIDNNVFYGNVNSGGSSSKVDKCDSWSGTSSTYYANYYKPYVTTLVSLLKSKNSSLQLPVPPTVTPGDITADAKKAPGKCSDEIESAKQVQLQYQTTLMDMVKAAGLALPLDPQPQLMCQPCINSTVSSYYTDDFKPYTETLLKLAADSQLR